MNAAPGIIILLLIVLSLVGLAAWLVLRFFGWIGLVIISAVGILLIALIALLDNPKARVAAVRTELEKIPNIRITAISDLEKQASESITAHVEVAGKGVMGFASLERASFKNSRHLLLDSIGAFGFCSRTKVDGQQSYAWWIDIGRDSPIPAARALALTSVQSAIAHYDELLALVSDWPITANEWPPRWPVKEAEWSQTSKEEIHFTDLKGSDYFFCLRRVEHPAQPK